MSRQFLRLASTAWFEVFRVESVYFSAVKMREIVHLQAGQCGNQIGAKVISHISLTLF